MPVSLTAIDDRRRPRDRAAPARRADPLRPERPHPQRSAGGADRRLDPGIRLDQPDPRRRRERHHRRPRPGAGGAQARPRHRAGDRARPPQRGAEARLHPRRQPAAPSSRLGHRAAGAGARRAAGPRARPRQPRLRRPASSMRCSTATSPTRARRRRRSRRRSRSRAPAISGCSASTGCSAAAAPMRPPWTRLLGGVRPHLMVSDPPFGVNYDPAWRNRTGPVGDQAHGQGAERRPGGLARGLGAVPRRGRLRLARRAARHHRGREPHRLRLRDPVARSSGRRSGWCSPAATTTGSTSPLVRGAGEGQGPLERRPQADDALEHPEPRPGRRDGARHPEAGRGDAAADAQQQLARSGGVRAVLRIRDEPDRRRDLRPRLALDGARPGLRRRRRPALAGLHRRQAPRSPLAEAGRLAASPTIACRTRRQSLPPSIRQHALERRQSATCPAKAACRSSSR